ncbi:MAG: hypothetical protein QXM16_01310 [Nitrososphaerota archaeon]
MPRRHELLVMSLAVILALLFILFNSPPLSLSSSSAVSYVSNIASPVESGITVKVKVTHQIGNETPKPPITGLVFVVLGGNIADLDAKGEAIFSLSPGNYSLIVSWRDGILYPFRTIVRVEKPLLILVSFREERLIPDSLLLMVNYTTDSSKVEMQYMPPSDKTIYASTPIITTIDQMGRKLVYPTHEAVAWHITPRPYYISLQPSAGYILYDVVIPVLSSANIIVPWSILSVVSDETFIPIQITNATIVEGDIEWSST